MYATFRLPALLAIAFSASACGAARVSTPAPLIRGDSTAVTIVAPGVVHHAIFRASGPWAIHVLDVDRAACWSPAALKGGNVAVGRARTSAMLAGGRTSGDTVAAVNADFFLFAPPGAPTGLHVDDGLVLSGPGRRPTFALDSAGRMHLRRFTLRGFAAAGIDSMPLSEWNHMPVTALGAFDQRWGLVSDTSSTARHVIVAADGRVARVVQGALRDTAPHGGWILTATARGADSSAWRWIGALRDGDPVRVHTALAPFHPLDAVGGFPMLVRDSSQAPVLDSASVRGLSLTRHPRTALGFGRGGERLLLVVVDGRQPGYSVGMTLPELAALMRELGAHDAINLDGGGSSAMAVRRADASVAVVNRPSDSGGERSVGNALAVVRGCAR